MPETLPLIVAGRAEKTTATELVRDPFTGAVLHEACQADAAVLERAIAAADRVKGRMAALPGHVRRDVLSACIARIETENETLAQLCMKEAGKPITAARGEVSRMLDTFRAAAQEAVALTRGVGSGEVLALDGTASAAGYRGLVKRVPVGPCAFITPFNFPLNLVAHKAAPAIAAGCPFVLKPAPATPGCALALGKIMVEALAEHGAPAEAVSVLPMPVGLAAGLVRDERFRLLSFTGSAAVGWALKAQAGRKKVVLELGGNAACVIDEGADLELAVPKIVNASFGYAGQSCISVQRLLVHRALIQRFRERLLESAKNVKVGDPSADNTLVGPVIDAEAAERIREWIREAVSGGASFLLGERGNADEAASVVQPTILEHVPHDVKLWAEEVFGPVIVLEAFDDFDDALRLVNDSDYGLQAGVFTPSLDHALRAWDGLEVGGVMINDAPSWRADPMPYGGVKGSGLGREGVRYAVEDMTEPRLCVIAP